jgi:dienelactone hydrolase
VAEVLLFHHIQGLTEGVQAFADDLRSGGHTVHTPDLYGGRTFGSIQEGFAFSQQVGGDEFKARAAKAVGDLPEGLVYSGISFGVGFAQRLAQTRQGAKGALLYESCIPITGEWAFGPWPEDVPVQIHGMDEDEFFAKEGDIDAAREIVATVGPDLAELYTYPGDQHLFADRSLTSYDAEAAALLTERTLAFLDRVT